MSDKVDFIEEIRIARFWRKQLGEYEYVGYNADDLRRWYIALETRGPEEIRSYIEERTTRYPMGPVTGIVATAPHPPLAIVQIWLESYNTVNTRSVWIAGAAFLVFVYFAAINIAGFQNLRSASPLQMNPPVVGGAAPPVGNTLIPQPTATLPRNAPAPASAAASPQHSH